MSSARNSSDNDSSVTVTDVVTNHDLSALESQRSRATIPASHWELVTDQIHVTEEVLNHTYKGSGTEEDPYVVEYIPHDRRNPMRFPMWKKWSITMLVAIATLAVAFSSSTYAGGVEQVIEDFGCSEEVATLGISMFVVGFAIGPLLWAPLSEMYGRQVLYVGTYAMLTAFNAACAGAPNIQSLIILRFFAGSFGSSPLTNAGGVIADMFPASQRGLAMSVFAAAPFLGPTAGPIVGGFVGQSVGWRWVMGVIAIFTGVLWIVGTLTIPETYAPVILRRRAHEMSKITGKVYKSRIEIDTGGKSVSQEFKIALSRPWVLLIFEPIVLLLSIYMAIIYGTLYMCFGAFPIVYEEDRGWSQGVGGLAFIGVAIGMLIGVALTIPDNKRYERAAAKNGGFAPAEARLPPALVGSVALPIGLFWFAWTNYPSIHWIVSIIGTAPFGFGMVLIFLSIMNYLIDSYVIYAASVLAANSVLRSLFGAIFPLFTTYMFDNLGIHWASSIPAFLALACTPFPFFFYKYGPQIRARCKFAAEAARVLQEIQEPNDPDEEAGVEAEANQVPETPEDRTSLASKHEEKEKEDEKLKTGNDVSRTLEQGDEQGENKAESVPASNTDQSDPKTKEEV